MSINFNKYHTDLSKAWQDILDDKISTDWALFGYEKQSDDLMLVASGDGGIEELAEDLNSGKIMYALCRVVDPNTGLPKFVFINWQGEGAPLSRKGSCTNHVVAVSNFFKGTHITINARTEDDVSTEAVLEKVAKASASIFNFKDRSDPVENIAPVSSVYKRIQPIKEINPREREKFWEKEQAEEKKRVTEEKKKADADRKRLDLERRERELTETAARNEAVKQRAHSINQVKAAERYSDEKARKEQEKELWEKQLQDDVKDEQQRKIRSESLRKERSFEAHNLISQRTINARAIFEKNTCAGQLSSITAPKQSRTLQNYESQFRDSDNVEENRNIVLEETKKEETNNPRTDTISPELYNKTVEHMHLRQDSEIDHNVDEEQNWDEPTLEAPPDVKDPLREMLAEHGIIQQTEDNTPPVIISSNPQDGLRARALYDYQAADETEISFDPDDLIIQIEQIDEGWWQGKAPDGTYGLFPANYVELLE